MYPRIRFISPLILLMAVISAVGYSNNPPVVFNERPALNFDFESCNALGALASFDYSEMQPLVIQNAECTDLSMISPSLYRINPQNNRHSCAPGVQGGIAMCISGNESCNFTPNAQEAIRVNVVVAPGPDGLGALDNISFHSKSPENFEFINGFSGPNNYPTRLRVRITSDGKEVYLSEERATTLDWTFKVFDLEGVPGLTVSESTNFQIEILPYCLVGNGAVSKAWDIDNLSISAGCTSLNAGTITTTSNTEFCSGDSGSLRVDLSVNGQFGDGFAWIALDANNNIARVSSVPAIEFLGLPSAQYFVHHLAFVGTLSGLVEGQPLSSLQGCFDLSNPITVNIRQVAGGNLSTSTGSASIDFCVNNSSSTFLVNLNSNIGTAVDFVLVSSTGMILSVYPTSNIDLSGIPSGNYNLIAVSSDGPVVNLTPGALITIMTGCTAFSNPIEVNVNAEGVSAGSLSQEGETTVEFCGEPGLLSLDLVGASGQNSDYIVTNFNGNILLIADQLPIDLSTITETQCFVRHISYVDGLTGLEVNALASNLVGCFELSNTVVVNKNDGLVGQGGTLTTPDGQSTFVVCPNQNNFAFNANLTGNGGSNVLYVLTDGDEIVFVYDTPNINLGLVGSGNFSLTALSFDNTISGLVVGQNLSDLDGCFALSNSISISTTSTVLDGGVLTMLNGLTSASLCNGMTGLGNASAGLDIQLSGAVGPLSSFIVTDTDGNILLLSDEVIDDFSTITVDTCNVWHLSYEPGIAGLQVGQSALELVGCFDLSDPLTITKLNVDGGTLSSNGQDSIVLCVVDSLFARVPVTLTDTIGEAFAWVIVDADREILQVASVDLNGNIVLDNTLPSTVEIVNISYEGTLLNLMAGSNLSDLSADCFALSNSLTVTREVVLGGSIDGPVSYDICLNDVGNTGLSLSVSGLQGNFNTWLVTDTDGNVLESNTTSTFDFAGTPADTCLIYSLSHSTTPISYSGAPSIANLNLACFDLSEPVSVVRKEVEGGTLALDSGDSSATVVIDPNNPAMLELELDGATGESNAFIITNAAGIIQRIQNSSTFTFTESGVCFIQNVSYCGNIEGLDIDLNLTDLAGCFDLSNQIQVIKEEDTVVGDTLFAGTIITSDSLTAADVCIGLMSLIQTVDVVFQSNPIGGDTSTFVVTDAAGMILETTQTPSFDFDAAGVGVCVIYHLVYDTLTSGLTGNINQLSGEFNLSNPIVITRTAVQGGTLTTTDSLTSIEVIVNDGLQDVVNFLSEGAQGDSTVVIITDNQGRILEFPTLPLVFDMDTAGVCMVWNLTFNEPLLGLAVGELVADLDGCFALSNPVTITKTPFVSDALAGGVLSIDISDICLGQDSLVTATLLSAQGDDSAYAITDTSGIILEIIDSTAFAGTTIFVAANTPVGLCEIVHISSMDTLTGLVVGEDLDTLAGNFELSNVVTIDRRAVNGGVLSTPSGLDTFNIVIGDGIIDSIEVNLAGAIGDSTQWLVTDVAGIVLDLDMSPPFTFETTPPGTCLIWNLSSSFGSSIAVGDDATMLDGCYDLSNPITVIRTGQTTPAIVGGFLGANISEVCLGQDSIVVTTLVMAEGQNSDFAVTDTLGQILEVIDSTAFVGAAITVSPNTPVGICEIVHISSDSTLTGLVVGQNIGMLGGNFELSNTVTIDRRAVDGGVLTTPSGLDTFDIIIGDGTIDSIEVNLAGAIGDSTQWVVTDAAGVVLDLSMTSPFTFETTPPGTCLIWNLSTAFGSSIAVGDDATMLGGCADLSNPIVVNRTGIVTGVNGGVLSTIDGLDTISICLNTTMTTLDSVLLVGAVGDSSSYILSDATGFILAEFDNPPFNFVNTFAGTCFVNHISFNGPVMNLAAGGFINQLSGDFDLSNTITVLRDESVGGTLMTVDSLTEITITVGDMMADIIDVVLDGAAGDSTQWLITDTVGVIIDLPLTEPFDFTNAAPGVCRIWNLSYATGLSGLAVGNNVSVLEGCFDLSNPITVTKEEAPFVLLGGTLMTADSMITAEICLSGLSQSLELILEGAQGDNSDFAVVNSAGTIIAVFNGTSFDFSGSGPQVCEVVHISSDSTLTGLALNEPLDSLGGNFELSNTVTVSKVSFDGGVLVLPNNAFSDTILVNDGIDETFTLINTNTSGDSILFVLTTGTDTILDVQMSNTFVFADTLDTGLCRIRSVAYGEGGLSGLDVGNNFNLDPVGCFDASNVVTIVKQEVLGDTLIAGTIATLSGGDTLDLCVGANGGVIDLTVDGAVGANQAWILSDTTGNIFAVPTNLPITLNTLVADVCEFRHIVYDSISNLNFNSHIDSLTGAFLLSNVVTINKSEISANSIELSTGGTSIDITVADNMIDSLFVTSTAISADTSVYLLIDGNGLIQSIQEENLFTFGPQVSSTCQIYEASFDFGFNGLVLGAALNDIDGCFALSNSIEVNKISAFVLNGGIVTSTQGNNINICKTDMVNDTIFASVTSAMGTNSAWVITDTLQNIVDLPMAPPFVLDTSSLDQCEIWHLSFESPLTGLAIGNNISALSGSFDLSDDPIIVTKNSAIAGVLSLPGGGSVDSLFLGSAPVDSVFVNVTGIAADTSSWLVTDTLGNITFIPNGQPPFAFENLNPGTCQLWNLAYTFGLTGFQNGNSPADFDGCFELSNPITIIKTQATNTMASGGTISLVGGGTEHVRCVGNTTLDSIEVVATGQVGTNFTYFITNKTGVILNIQDTIQFLQDTTLVSVEGNGDSLRLYHIGFDTTITGFGPLLNISGIGGSFGLSDPILLTAEVVSAGIINTSSNTTIISGDGISDEVIIAQIGTVVGDTTFYVVYDDQGVIVQLEDQPVIDFDSYAAGTYFVTFLSANAGFSGVEVGSNIEAIDGCFDTATPIQIDVTEAAVSGGILTAMSGGTTVDLCFNSTTSMDSVGVVLTDTIGLDFAWVITDLDGNILDLPSSAPFFFDNQDSVTCEIFNVSFDSTLVGLTIGEDIDNLSSNGLFVFSNAITVTKNIVNGGMLTTAAGATTEQVCIGEGGIPDQLFMSLTGAIGDELTYVVTGLDSIVTEVINGGTTAITVESFVGDTCLVFNLSSNQEILGLTAGVNINELLGCSELSNPITLIKNQVDAGVISAMPVAIDNTIDFCVSDGIADSLVVSSNSVSGNYQFVVTDENDVITQIATSDTFNFEGSSFGVCKIYGISYIGNFIASVGDNVINDPLSDDCFIETLVPLTINKLDCSQPVINEVYENNQVEIINLGTTDIDISNYFLCSNMVYAQLSNLTTTCGDYILQPGELVVVDVDGTINVDGADGEMALYVDSSFGQSSSIRSYVEWGSTGHFRSGIAVIAGLWTTGEFAAIFASGASLNYDGDGILGSDWSAGIPSECAENLEPGAPTENLQISYQFFPNPAQEQMTLVIESLPEESGQLIIYDSYGKVVMRKDVKGATSYEMDLSTYGPGVFHAKVVCSRSDKVSRFIILE
jgi:hypothetical protein